jgi:hypothetical protein
MVGLQGKSRDTKAGSLAPKGGLCLDARLVQMPRAARTARPNSMTDIA